MLQRSLDATTATTLRKLLQELRSLLAAGQVKEALQLAYQQLPPYCEVDPVLQMLSRWNQAERDRLQQLISEDEFTVSRAKVTTLFGHFLNELADALVATGLVEGSQQEEGTSDKDANPPIFSGKKQILVLYAEGDLGLWREVRKHLFLVQKMPAFHWSDAYQDLPPGLTNDFTYLQQWIEVSEKVLCLVTPNILAYPTYPLAEHAAAAGKLIPIKLVELDLGDTVFEPLGSLPSDNRFASQWPDTNAAYTDIAQQLRRFLQRLADA